MADAFGCEVHWYWKYWYKTEPVTDGKANFYRDFGTLVHTALAYHYARRMDRTPQWLIDYPSLEEALEADSFGNETWLKRCDEIMTGYRRWYAEDIWTPVYVEEEFEATIGQLDPDGIDEPAQEIPYQITCGGLTDERDENGNRIPCTNRDENGAHIPHKVDKVLRLPHLNDEIVTCRPDIIFSIGEHLYIGDHKTAGGAKDGSGRLPIVDEHNPDYKYIWQAMVNLWIVRQSMPIRGFTFNRIKRDTPYDYARDDAIIKQRAYDKVPRTMRETIRRERQIAIKAATNPSSLVGLFSRCNEGFGCPYKPLCYTDTTDARDDALTYGFKNDA